MDLFIIVGGLILVNSRRKKLDKGMRFVGYTNEIMPHTLVVDCSHQTSRQLTHHLKGVNQKKLMDLSLRGDTSTDSVLNAIKTNSPMLGLKNVSSNHFDVDSFISCWSCINPILAAKHDQILREVARIGDFRELLLDHPYQDTALQLTCWLNSEEKKLFYKPFESKISLADGEEEGIRKFAYFLPLFGSVLNNPSLPDYEVQWREEYNRVVKEYHIINSLTCLKYFESNIGLVVVNLTDPIHYYSLFSISRGFDIVLSCYEYNRYELETKYTSMIDLDSRGTLPRVDMKPLTVFLNSFEKLKQVQQQSSVEGDRSSGVLDPPEKIDGEAENKETEYHWHCDRITDSGPILRLETKCRNLTKAERYGHPYERPIYSSLICPEDMRTIVVSFFSHAYRGVKVQSDHEWSDLHSFNRGIRWDLWTPLDQENLLS